MTEPEIVDLYLRKSNKDGGRSAARQETDLTAEAADAGLTIGRTFVDPDLSASRFARKGRPDYAALLDHIRSGACRLVGVVEASRGSRTLTEWSAFLDLCRARKVRIWVQTHDRIYDLSRRRDWKALADEGVDSANESEIISERTLSGKRKGAADGRPAGRNIYGHLRQYEATPKGPKVRAIVAHPEQAPVVREMVERVGKGERLYAIAADLNTRKVPTPTGRGPWRPATVRQTVLRPAHVGKRIHHGEVLGDAMWPAIVDEAQWRRAVAVLTRPDRRTQRGTALAHWLSGAVLCGVCRREPLRPGTRGRYMCKADGCFGVSIASEPLERLIEAAVLARLADPGFADAFRAERPDTAELEAELADLRATLAGHYAEARARRLSPGGLAIVEAGLLEDIDRVERKLNAVELPADLAEIGEPAEIIERWADLDATQRRTVVRAVAALVVLPAVIKGGRGLDPTRLDESRWTGDALTWGERRA